VIWVGIDDTDTLDTPGTNQLARALARRLEPGYQVARITRHQLLFDPRVPYTSKNGSASLLLEPRGEPDWPSLIDALRAGMRERFVPGSDPGLCVARAVPAAVVAFGRRCQRELVAQHEARNLAAECGAHLEGLGGTEGGVIGALAAVGLAATSDDGRVVQLGAWPDDLAGVQDVATLHTRGVYVRRRDGGEPVTAGRVDVGNRLRPNLRGGAVVLYVTPAGGAAARHDWEAVRLP
jgi:hypothetical protein